MYTLKYTQVWKNVYTYVKDVIFFLGPLLLSPQLHPICNVLLSENKKKMFLNGYKNCTKIPVDRIITVYSGGSVGCGWNPVSLQLAIKSNPYSGVRMKNPVLRQKNIFEFKKRFFSYIYILVWMKILILVFEIFKIPIEKKKNDRVIASEQFAVVFQWKYRYCASKKGSLQKNENVIATGGVCRLMRLIEAI